MHFDQGDSTGTYQIWEGLEEVSDDLFLVGGRLRTEKFGRASRMFLSRLSDMNI